jgi:hypothetical protein
MAHQRVYSVQAIAMLRKLAVHENATAIAKKLNAAFSMSVRPSSVRRKCDQIGIQLCPKVAATIKVGLHGDVGRTLATAAQERSTSVHKLASRILTIVVRDQLLDAVLDDAEPAAEVRRAGPRRPNGGASVNAAAPRS